MIDINVSPECVSWDVRAVASKHEPLFKCWFDVELASRWWPNLEPTSMQHAWRYGILRDLYPCWASHQNTMTSLSRW